MRTHEKLQTSTCQFTIPITTHDTPQQPQALHYNHLTLHIVTTRRPTPHSTLPPRLPPHHNHSPSPITPILRSTLQLLGVLTPEYTSQSRHTTYNHSTPLYTPHPSHFTPHNANTFLNHRTTTRLAILRAFSPSSLHQPFLFTIFYLQITIFLIISLLMRQYTICFHVSPVYCWSPSVNRCCDGSSLSVLIIMGSVYHRAALGPWLPF